MSDFRKEDPLDNIANAIRGLVNGHSYTDEDGQLCVMDNPLVQAISGLYTGSTVDIDFTTLADEVRGVSTEIHCQGRAVAEALNNVAEAIIGHTKALQEMHEEEMDQVCDGSQLD